MPEPMIVDSSEHVIEGAGGHQPVTIPASARGRNQKMEKQKPMRQKKIPGPGRRCYRRCSSKCLAPVTRDTWPTDWPRPSTAPYATSPTRLESRDQLQGFRLIFLKKILIE